MITDSTVLVRSEGLEVAQLKGEAVVLNVKTGMYYGLNPLGLRIFELLKKPTRVRDLVRTLSGEVTVESRQLRTDVFSFLHDLCEQELVDVMDDGTEA